MCRAIIVVESHLMNHGQQLIDLRTEENHQLGFPDFRIEVTHS
jgi:hypothetical protein